MFRTVANFDCLRIPQFCLPGDRFMASGVCLLEECGLLKGRSKASDRGKSGGPVKKQFPVEISAVQAIS
jgi:hypothetical protein